MHKAKAIIDAFSSALSTASISSFQSRTRSVEPAETPCVIVMMGSETRNNDIALVTNELDIELELKVSTSESLLDTELLDLREKIELAIYQKDPFNLPFVVDVKLTEISKPIIATNADIPVTSATMTYTVVYRYFQEQPSV